MALSRVAVVIRIATLVTCPPLLALAYEHYCGNLWYSALLAYAPVAGGWIGLASRPILDAAAQRVNPRYEYSGKGFILGSAALFLSVFAFAPSGADRTSLIALFLASSSLYYAMGKVGCLLLGCCRATVNWALPLSLPLFETISSCVLTIAALLTLSANPAFRLWCLPVIVIGFLALRIASRQARGSRLRDALHQLDSVALAGFALYAFVIAIVAA